MNKHPRLFQLLNCDDECSALFICFDSPEEISDKEVVEAIENAYKEAERISEAEKGEGCDDIHGNAELVLEKKNIERTFASEVFTNVI